MSAARLWAAAVAVRAGAAYGRDVENPHRIVILGAGTGGTLTANRLRRLYGDRVEIVVVDRDDRHVYQPGLLFVPFGLADPDEIVRLAPSAAARRHRLPPGRGRPRRHRRDTRPPRRTARRITYDVLVIASGAALLPEETEGLTGPGWGERSSPSSSSSPRPRCASALRRLRPRPPRGQPGRHADQVPGRAAGVLLPGRLVPARARRPRRRASITYVTSLDGAFTKPVASEHLAGLLAREGHRPGDRVRHRRGRRRRRAAGQLRRARGAVRPARHASRCTAAPRTSGARPGLGDELGFVADRSAHAAVEGRARTSSRSATPRTCRPPRPARSRTSRATRSSRTSRRFLAGEALEASFDGHANCFIETGFHKALLIDFNYDVEPLPGRFPEPHVGPLPLLKESRLNHMAKLAFQWVYWHVLLPGHDMPGISSQLQLAGKDLALLEPRRTTMTPLTLAGHRRRPRRRGLLLQARAVDPRRWRDEIARDNGIAELTDRHWQVIDFMRDHLPRDRLGADASARSASSPASRSRSSTSSSPRARRSSPPRSPASPSRAAASRSTRP